ARSSPVPLASWPTPFPPAPASAFLICSSTVSSRNNACAKSLFPKATLASPYRACASLPALLFDATALFRSSASALRRSLNAAAVGGRGGEQFLNAVELRVGLDPVRFIREGLGGGGAPLHLRTSRMLRSDRLADRNEQALETFLEVSGSGVLRRRYRRRCRVH